MDLREWAEVFIRNKALFDGSEVKSEGQAIIAEKAGKVSRFIVEESLSKERLEKAGEGDNFICLNNKDNLGTLLSAWKSLAKIQALKVIFANPKANTKWMVSPHIHDRIADQSSLEAGLSTLAESVEEAR